MKEEDLLYESENFNSYIEILCKAILLDKVKISKGRIIVENFDD